jgi:hypothetical protein
MDLEIKKTASECSEGVKTRDGVVVKFVSKLVAVGENEVIMYCVATPVQSQYCMVSIIIFIPPQPHVPTKKIRASC